jgi:uncharacterized protein (TIGR00255 family)
MKSMTGFARAQWQDQDTEWQIEIKAVNGRNLDLRLRLPDGHDVLDSPVRQYLGAQIRRGSVNVAITTQRKGGTDWALNTALLERLTTMRQELIGKIDPALPSLAQLLAIPGMVSVKAAAGVDENLPARLMAHLLEPATSQFNAHRTAEGEQLLRLCLQHVQQIEILLGQAEARLPAQAEAMQQKLHQQLQQLPNVTVDPARLAQELALLLLKADVREELDRLRAHVLAAKKLCAEADAVGRKLDFLAQEFNREANTLCAKSADIELTQIGLGLKNAIDQLREQVQNIE